MITAEEILKINNRDIICINEDATLYEALKKMIDNKSGEISVVRKGKIIGIWTERDLLRDIFSESFDLSNSKISEFMIPTVHTAPHTATLSDLQHHFFGTHIRHLYIEKDDEIIGLISSGDIMEAGLNFQTKEVEELSSYVGLQYYENWTIPGKERRML